MIRRHLHKQSDLGLPHYLGPFGRQLVFKILRTFTIGLCPIFLGPFCKQLVFKIVGTSTVIFFFFTEVITVKPV